MSTYPGINRYMTPECRCGICLACELRIEREEHVEQLAAAKRDGARELANLLMAEIGARFVAGYSSIEVLEIVTAKCVSLIDPAEPKKAGE